MRTMTRWWLGCGLVLLVGGQARLAVAEEAGSVPEPSWRAASQAAVSRGVAYLIRNQQESGAWSDTNFPALTALPVLALVRSGDPAARPAIDKAVMYLRSCIRADAGYEGAIFRDALGKGGGLSTYNTALSMLALHEAVPEDATPVLNARAFLAKSQYLGEGLHHGGMGYDAPTGRPYSDLSNSYLAYDAMRRTQGVEDLRQGERVDLDWKAAVGFIQRVQNDSRFNALPWASDDPSEQGGFAYQPDTFRPTAGAYEKDGVVKYRTMSGMSYAGLLAYLHAGVRPDDPRVRAVYRWVTENWDLESGNRNPEMTGKLEALEGLYYMYDVMAKALQSVGADELQPASGNAIRWREALAAKLVSLQEPEGSWVNRNSRYMEGDRNLVTAYGLLALENALAR